MTLVDEENSFLVPNSFENSLQHYIFMKSENDLPTIANDTVINSQLIYSEPALVFDIYKSDAIQLPINDSGVASLNDNEDTPKGNSRPHLAGHIKRTAFCLQSSTSKNMASLSDSRAIEARGTAGEAVSLKPNEPKQSFSAREIRDQHLRIQTKYRPARKRHYTDPVDFEGILNIIGGCSWWQIWIYLLISFQQVPHAMFNLSVVYMMYQPDHWCKVPGFEENDFANYGVAINWTWVEALNSGIAFPMERNVQRNIDHFHDQCGYYVRNESRYQQFLRMTLRQATTAADKERVPVTRCQSWQFETDVMQETIVTEWNLVCGDSMKRAHAHLFYSLGYLVGCLLGGFASDRFGRKPTIIGFGILSSMFGLILPYSTYFPMFLMIRFLGAICNEAADLAAYVLCMEITGTKYRAMVGSLLQAPWAVGYAMLALLAYLTKSWRVMQLITAALHTVAVLLVCVLPESPRWLIVNNRVREAERYIRKACRFNKSSLPSDLELVKHAEQRKWVKRNQRANMLHLLKSRALLLRTAVVFVVWIATALVYYGLVIALSDQSAPGRALFSGNFFVNNAIAGAIELPTLLACVFLLKYGRKRSQMVTLTGAGLFIGIAMIAINQKQQMVALVFLLFGKVFIQGAFNILYIFTSELYPTVIRNSAVGASSMIARTGSAASSYIAILSDVTLPMVPMLIFAVFSLIAGTLVVFLPETRDQPLPDTLQDAVTFLRSDVDRCVDLPATVSVSVDPPPPPPPPVHPLPAPSSRKNTVEHDHDDAVVADGDVRDEKLLATDKTCSLLDELAAIRIPHPLPEAFEDD